MNRSHANCIFGCRHNCNLSRVQNYPSCLELQPTRRYSPPWATCTEKTTHVKLDSTNITPQLQKCSEKDKCTERRVRLPNYPHHPVESKSKMERERKYTKIDSNKKWQAISKASRRHLSEADFYILIPSKERKNMGRDVRTRTLDCKQRAQENEKSVGVSKRDSQEGKKWRTKQANRWIDG